MGLLALLDGQRGALFPWAPVMFAIGIGGYFGLRVEPHLSVYGMLVVIALAAVVLAWRGPMLWQPVVIAIALIATGFCVAGWRSHSVAAPVLGFRYYGPVEGRIVRIDRSASDVPRLTLDRVVLSRMAPQETPERVRVSLHGAQDWVVPQPGMRVMMTAHLSPPRGPIEPGGFDFRLNAWFAGLGAMGYTRTPVLSAAPPEGAGLYIYKFRKRLSDGIRAAMPARTGGVAAAIVTGDRSGIDKPVIEDLRGSNLAHLLAISGLHMGLLTGFVFAALRYAGALVPWIALRWPVKKIAAGCAICVGALYLAMSGGNVATERAFIMVTVMLAAILVDRRALSLRSVAIAALIVLTLRPEALLGPGFQMSFAATTALVVAFGALRDASLGMPGGIWRGVGATVMSSAVAGAATAPIAAAHFNRIADYGLIANVVSVPVMGLVVMPFAVLAACLAPFGLAGVALWGMHLGLWWILAVAEQVASWPGAVSHVIRPAVGVLPMLSLGALIILLWRGGLRAFGAVPMAIALVLWGVSERPTLLISDTGGLIGVMTPEGRALSKPKGDGFVALGWLENDGDGADQALAHGRDPGVFEVGTLSVAHLSGRGMRERLEDSCATHDWVILTVDVEPTADCRVFDPKTLRALGAVAVYTTKTGFEMQTVSERAGQRLWTEPSPQ